MKFGPAAKTGRKNLANPAIAVRRILGVGGGEKLVHFGGSRWTGEVVTLCRVVATLRNAGLWCIGQFFFYAGRSPSLGPCARYDWPLIVRMIAPSTMRSRKAMATGPSGRYSPHFSKSTLVASAVDFFWFRRAMIL